MNDRVLKAEGNRVREVAEPMSFDEQLVRERFGVVRDLLQAQRARGGGFVGETNAPLRSSVASFVERARSDGWTRAFDETIAVAQSIAADAAHRAEMNKVIAYLVEVEPHVVRLAQTRRGPTIGAEKDTTNSFLCASTGGVPALHRMTGFGTVPNATRWAADFVEPGALIQLRALSRDVLDELASLALLRVPQLDEPWTIGAGFEERLLQMLDAAVALSRGAISLDIVRAARKQAEASPVAEPYRWFVPTFLLACTEGEHAMDALREVFVDAPQGMLGGLVDAVCLGSNPDRGTMALSLLDEDDRPEILCAALDVLVRLGRPIEGRLLEFVEHPHADVATRAAMAASLTSRAEDVQNVVHALRPLLTEDDRSTFVACVLTMLAPEMGAVHLREVVRRGTKEGASADEVEQAVDAAEALAALGQTRDSEQLMTLAGVSDEAFRALATFGTPEALEFLRAEVMRRVSSPRQMQVCVRAIERITGILEEDEPMPEGRARARETWLRDMLAFVIPKEASRVRLGRAFQPAALVEELRHPGTRARTRRSLVQEARILGANPIPIDLDGWLIPQRNWLDLAKNAGWPNPTRRS